MKIKVLLSFPLIFLILILQTKLIYAHSVIQHVTIIQPNDSEVLEGNTIYQIQWKIDESINEKSKWNIRYTSDFGSHWNIIAQNLDFDVRAYDWLVPNIDTTDGIINVVLGSFENPLDGKVSDNTFTIIKSEDNGSMHDIFYEFDCDTPLSEGFMGFKRLMLNIGDEESCVFKLIEFNPDVFVGISTNLRTGRRTPIEIFPTNGVTDENGELEFIIRAVDKGKDFLRWAIVNEDGQFNFSRNAFKKGKAWGIFVEVKE